MDKVLETTYSKVYLDGLSEKYSEFLDYIADNFDSRLEEILNFLEIPEFIDYGLKIYLYSTKESYKEYVKSQGGQEIEYGLGSFEEKCINRVITETDLSKFSKTHLLNKIMHECVHLLYFVFYQLKDEESRVIWFDEGLACNLSGEMGDCRDLDKFKSFYLKNIVNRHLNIPKIEYLLKHGTKYGEFKDAENNLYDGYYISYVIVRYLLEVLPKDRLFNLLGNFEEIMAKGEKYLNEAIKYYDILFPVSDNFSEVKDEFELMDYLNKEFLFGYLDSTDKIHANTLTDFKELYRTHDIPTIIEKGYATCIEYMQVISFALKRFGYDVRTFALRDINHLDTYRFMFIIAFSKDEKWYIFEYTNSQKQNIFEFKDIDAYVHEYRANMEKSIENGQVELTEFESIPANLSYEELHKYLAKK
ncbi:MAG: hypothetical protein K2G03_01345 [Bacilli bacterium]|nr:hypothetical protein [Bacilli bacterium]